MRNVMLVKEAEEFWLDKKDKSYVFSAYTSRETRDEWKQRRYRHVVLGGYNKIKLNTLFDGSCPKQFIS